MAGRRRASNPPREIGQGFKRSGARAEDEGGSSGSEEWDRHAAMHAEAEADERYGRRRSAADAHAHRTCGWCGVLYGTPARAPHGHGSTLPLKGHSRVLDEGTTGMTG